VVESGVLLNVNFNVDNKDSFWVVHESNARCKSFIDRVEEAQGVVDSVSDDVFRRIPLRRLMIYLPDIRDEIRELISHTQARCGMDGWDDPNVRKKVTSSSWPDP
jgi:hypothetical protein